MDEKLRTEKELVSKIINQYKDLSTTGKTEDEMLEILAADIVHADEKTSGSKDQHVFSYEEIQKHRKKTAMILSISIFLYVLGVAVLIVLSAALEVDSSIAVSLMLAIDAAATALIIYHFVSRPKGLKSGNEDTDEWTPSDRKTNEIIKSIKSILWITIAALYFAISFIFGIWAFSWIIFIIGAAIEKIITLTFQLKEQ